MPIQLIGHLLVPVVSLGIAWAILRVIRPDFDPAQLLTSTSPEPPQESSRKAVPNRESSPQEAATDSQPQAGRPSAQQEQDDQHPEPAREPNLQESPPPLKPMPKGDNLGSIDFLPDAVDLPPRLVSEWVTLAEQTSASDAPCRLLLISDRLAKETDHRLGLTESTSSSGDPVWAVSSQPVTAQSEQSQPPLGEFSWDEGRLKFRWKASEDDRLSDALHNSLLNVRIGDQEKLVQLRRPLKVPSLTLDLSNNVLQMPLEIPHPPTIENLRFQLTEVDFKGVDYQLADGQQDAGIGQKLPIFIKTPPGARFQVWVASLGDQLTFRAEGHYWLGSTTPVAFNKTHVERQVRAFVQRGTAGGLTKQGLAALQQVAKLGYVIHGQTPFHYRIYLPIEFDGVELEVVILEAAGPEVESSPGTDSTALPDSFANTPSRDPVPSESDREAARERLAAAYKSTYEQANDPASRRRLASSLLEQANAAADDLALQYEAFRLAWVILIQAGDLEAALEVSDQVVRRFEADRVALRAAMVRAAANAKSFSERLSVVVDGLLSVVDDAIWDEEHELAIELIDLAESLQEKTPGTQQTQEIEQRAAFLEAQKRLTANEDDSPSDPDAAETHLRFGPLALSQGRAWEDCLSILSRGLGFIAIGSLGITFFARHRRRKPMA